MDTLYKAKFEICDENNIKNNLPFYYLSHGSEFHRLYLRRLHFEM